MASTQARSGFGALLQRETTPGSGTYITLAEVTNIEGVEETLNMADATHMESPNSVMEKIPTLIEPGPVTLSLNFLPANITQQTLRADLRSKLERNYQILIPAAAGTPRFTFPAYVTSVGNPIPHDNKMTMSVTLTVANTGYTLSDPG